ncbi:ribulose bisphosphate carboxylase/oxygenase activase [Populus alba x Populus x berolinensis]|nr:ribulose bisphosphate carboxylase/oxygenase activase [Populus alba x Populus x berolinensis]
MSFSSCSSGKKRVRLIEVLFLNLQYQEKVLAFQTRINSLNSYCKLLLELMGDMWNIVPPDYLIKLVSSVDLSKVCHIVKNYLAHRLNVKVPLILGIWGGKGQGKSFQTELIFQTLGVEPVIMSAGELESERAGEPGRLIRERYRTASQVVQNQVRSFTTLTGKMSCLMINDIDAGLGRFGNTQMTVNNQIVVGTLMNLSDNPTRVSIGQDWRESDITNRVPIIVTGNDFSTIYAPLIRDGRMEKFYWQPNREDIVNIVHRMYEKDGISRDEVVSIVNKFPNQALDFYGALRSRTYDRSISKWVDDIGGIENLGKQLLRRKKDEKLPVFTPPEQTMEALLESGHSLIREQQLIMETKLSKEYMKNIDD